MTNTFTPNVALILQENGTNNNTWNDYLTDNFEMLDAKLGNRTTVNTTGGNTSLTATQERVAVVKATGTLVSNATITFTGVGGFWIIDNATSGSFSLTCKISGQTGVEVAQGSKALVYFNGTDIATAGALNTALTAINALTPAADKFPYYTSASAAALATVTTFARTILDDTDAATVKTTLGLTIGTNVQAWDADLDAIAALATASFGRSLLTQASASAARTTLGVAIGSDVQAYDADLTTLGAGGASARTFLGLAIGTDVQAYDGDLASIAALTTTSFGRSLLTESSASTARTTLGLGTADSPSFAGVDTDTLVINGGDSTSSNFILANSFAQFARDGGSVPGATVMRVHRTDGATTPSGSELIEFYADILDTPTQKGSITVSAGGVDYNTSSDARRKKNQRPLHDCWEIIRALRPKYWEWDRDDGPTDLGLVAQEVAAIPQLAHIPKRGDSNPALRPGDKGFEPWELARGATEPVLIAALQDVDRRLKAAGF